MQMNGTFFTIPHLLKCYPSSKNLHTWIYVFLQKILITKTTIYNINKMSISRIDGSTQFKIEIYDVNDI